MLVLKRRWLPCAFGILVIGGVAGAQSIRIATWNISQFTGTNRLGDIQTVLFSSGPVGAMNPDVLLAQEIQSSSAANAMLGALNTSQPGAWSVAFGSLTGTSSTSDTAVFYKSGKVSLADVVKVAPAGGTSGQPRDTWRFDFSILGNANSSERIAMYDVHMKSGSSGDDVSRRQIEAQHIRSDSQQLGANYHFLVAGDMNMQSSSQAPYQTLIAAGAGQFNDPISTPGTWNNNSQFRFVHTQDPSGNGGMDDRHDQILLSNSLVDGVGTDYVGQFGTAYSTSTWNDPNHSYRAWGNDGTSYGQTLTINGNQMVGSTIAQSIVNAATSAGGHIPVFLDMHYAAVPEPASLAALGLGALALARRRRNRK